MEVKVKMKMKMKMKIKMNDALREQSPPGRHGRSLRRAGTRDDASPAGPAGRGAAVRARGDVVKAGVDF